MPFGLCHSPQTFQRFINEVLYGIDFTFAYKDDVLIASYREEKHINHLRDVFRTLDEHYLTLNPENVHLVYQT